jgi:hypothetical protein
LWFGRAELESFAEHNPALAPSRLVPLALEGALLPALAGGLARQSSGPSTLAAKRSDAK